MELKDKVVKGGGKDNTTLFQSHIDYYLKNDAAIDLKVSEDSFLLFCVSRICYSFSAFYTNMRDISFLDKNS